MVAARVPIRSPRACILNLHGFGNLEMEMEMETLEFLRGFNDSGPSDRSDSCFPAECTSCGTAPEELSQEWWKRFEKPNLSASYMFILESEFEGL